MTQPLPRTPKAPPVSLASRPTVTARPSISGAPQISPETLGSKPVVSTLNPPRDKILLAGDTNSGKSYAWVQMAQADFVAENGNQYYMIDTDDTAPTFFSDGYEFAHLFEGNGGNVHVFHAPNWEMVARTANHITRQAKRGDRIIVDLASSSYALAQEFIANIRGLQLDDEVVSRMVSWGAERKKGFGAFDGDTWGIVSRTYEASMRPLVNNAKGAGFIGLAHVTDMQTGAGREQREPILLFDQLGMKPTGVGKLTKMVDTCVILWSARPMDEKGTRSEPRILRQMTVVKDRGEACHYTRPFTNFYTDLQKFRVEVTKTQNIVDPVEAEAVLTAARAAMNNTNEESESPADGNPDTPA